MEEKMNVMRILDQKKISYRAHCYLESGAVSGTEVASVLGEDPRRVFKTLVTRAKSGAHYVFMLPVCTELDLKKAAKAVNEKSVEMLPSKELLPLTGYVHGGCSPIGMKKSYPVVIDSSAMQWDIIFFSAGKIGYQVALSPRDLSSVIRFRTADITVNTAKQANGDMEDGG